MAVNVGTLQAILKLRDDLSPALRKAGNQIEVSGAKMAKAGQAASSLGTSLSMSVSAPLGILAATSIKTFATFEKSMNRVRALSGDMFDPAMIDQAKELGATTAFSATQAADAMGFLTMAGFDVNKTMEAMPGVLNLAAAAQMELGQTADITSNILTGYGKEASELGHVNDVLVNTFTKTNTDLTMLGESFKYAGPVAHAAGMQFEETAAMIGLMGNAGIQGSMAGTSLRGAITRLLDPGKKAADAMATMGLEITDAQGKMLPMADIVGQLEDRMASGIPKTQALTEIMQIFGLRAGPAMAGLVGQGADAIRKLTEEVAASGTAEKVAKTQMEGLSGAFVTLKSATEGARIAIGEALAGPLRSVVEVLTDAARFIGGTVMPAFAALPGPIKLAAIALGGLLIVGPPVLAMLGMLVSGIAGLAPIVGPVVGALGAGGGLAGVFSSVTAATAPLTAAMGSVGTSVTTMATSATGAAVATTAGVAAVGVAVGEAVNGMRAYGDELRGINDPTTQILNQQSLLTSTLSIAGDALGWVGDKIVFLGGKFLDLNVAVAEGIYKWSGLKLVVDGWMTIFKGVSAAISEASRALDGITAEMYKYEETTAQADARTRDIAKAQKETSVAVTTHAQALQILAAKANKAHAEVDKLTKPKKPPLTPEELAALSQEAAELADELEKLGEAMSLEGATEDASIAAQAIEEIGGVANMTTAAVRQYGKEFQALSDDGVALTSTQQQVVEKMKALEAQTKALEEASKKAAPAFKEVFHGPIDPMETLRNKLADMASQEAAAAQETQYILANFEELRAEMVANGMSYESATDALGQMTGVMGAIEGPIEDTRTGLEKLQDTAGGLSIVFGDIGFVMGAVNSGLQALGVSARGHVAEGLGQMTDGFNHASDAAGAFADGDFIGAAVSGIQAGVSVVRGLGSLFGGPNEFEQAGTALGEALGTGVSDEFIDTIMNYADEWGLTIEDALLMNLSEAAAETGQTFTEMADHVSALLDGVADGTLPLAEGLDDIANAFSELDAEARRGVAGAENAVLDLTDQLMAAVADGTMPLLDGVEQVGSAFSDMAQRAEDGSAQAQQGMLHMIQQARQLGLEVPEITEYVAEALSRSVEALGGITEGIQILSEEDAVSQATIFATTFWAAVQEHGFVEAVGMMEESFAGLQDALSAAGMGEAAEAIIGPMRDLFEAVNDDTRPVLEGVDALRESLGGLSDAGYMTRDAFAAFGQQAGSAFEQLTEAGMTEQQALMALAPMLADLRQQAEAYGMALDPATQALINQAENAGIEFPIDPMMQVVDLLGSIATALGATIPESAQRSADAMGGIGDSTRTAFDGAAAAAQGGAERTAQVWSVGMERARGASEVASRGIRGAVDEAAQHSANVSYEMSWRWGSAAIAVAENVDEATGMVGDAFGGWEEAIISHAGPAATAVGRIGGNITAALEAAQYASTNWPTSGWGSVPGNGGGGGGGGGVGGKGGDPGVHMQGGSHGWQNFGAGTPAVLHNTEAVIRPGDPVLPGQTGQSINVNLNLGGITVEGGGGAGSADAFVDRLTYLFDHELVPNLQDSLKRAVKS